MENMNLSFDKKLSKELDKELMLAKKDEKFIKLCQKLKIDDEVAKKYTSRLNDT